MKTRILFLLILLIVYTPSLFAMGKTPPKPLNNEASFPDSPKELNLMECFDLAMKRSETLSIHKEDIAIAEAQIFQATGEAIGDADFIITDTHQEVPKNPATDSSGNSVGSTFNARERREREFVITQPLFQGFKSIAALTGAGNLKSQREEEWQRAKDLLFLDVARAFYTFLKMEKDVTAIQDINILFKDRIKDLEERSKIGRSRAGEVATAKAIMKIHEADLERAKGAKEIARYTLEFLTGSSLENTTLKDMTVVSQTEDKLENLIGNSEYRSDVLAKESAMKTAKKAVLVAQSGFWPTISLEHTQYEKREGFQSGIDWDLMFKIDVPLFRGGSTFGEFKESLSKWKQAKFSHQLAERQAKLEVRQSFQGWLSSKKESEALQEAVKASDENYKIQKEDYEKNLVNNLDVLQSLEALLDTSRNANSSFYQTKINFWELQVASGNCCESL